MAGPGAAVIAVAGQIEVEAVAIAEITVADRIEAGVEIGVITAAVGIVEVVRIAVEAVTEADS